jgi:hypothetical protein
MIRLLQKGFVVIGLLAVSQVQAAPPSPPGPSPLASSSQNPISESEMGNDAHAGVGEGRTVVDAKGKFIGYLATSSTQRIVGESPDVVLIKYKEFWAAVSGVNSLGFIPGTNLYQNYITSNCTGQAYLDASHLPPDGIITGAPTGSYGTVTVGTLHMPGAPKFVTLGSHQNPLAAFACTSYGTGFVAYVGPQIDVPLNFTGPFSIQ